VGGIVAGAEVVVAGFGVAFLAFEFVVLRAGIGVGALTAVRIEIGIVADDSGVGGGDAGSAEKVFDVVDGIANDCGRAARAAPADSGMNSSCPIEASGPAAGP